MNLRDRIDQRKTDRDDGDVVQVVILIAGFVIVAILVIVWIGTAVMNKGADAAKCTESSSSLQYRSTNAENAANTDDIMQDNRVACGGDNFNTHSTTNMSANGDPNGFNINGGNSFQNDSGYTSRY